MGMKLVRYKVKNRTIRNDAGERVHNPDHNVEVVSGVWCSEKKKDISLGTLTWREFRHATGIHTCALTDPRGTQRQWIDESKWKMLRIALTSGESVELEVRRIR